MNFARRVLAGIVLDTMKETKIENGASIEKLEEVKLTAPKGLVGNFKDSESSIEYLVYLSLRYLGFNVSKRPTVFGDLKERTERHFKDFVYVLNMTRLRMIADQARKKVNKA